MTDFLLTIPSRAAAEPIACTAADIEAFLMAVMEERLSGKPVEFIPGLLRPVTGLAPTFLGEPLPLEDAGQLAATGYLILRRAGISSFAAR